MHLMHTEISEELFSSVYTISIDAIIIHVAHFSRYDAARYTSFSHYPDRVSEWWKNPIAGPLAEKCMLKFKLSIKRCTIY